MLKQSIEELSKEEISGKKVLVRVDFNVPIQKNNISDTTRIKAAIPTIEYIIKNEGKVILISHLGRPKGKKDDSLSLRPISLKLSEIMKRPVIFSDVVIEEKAKSLIDSMNNGDILMLENIRFHKEETKNSPVFSKKLADLADIYVNDSFGTAHRAHCSTEGVARHLDGYLGLLFKKEITILNEVLSIPKKPLVAIIGGAKVSTKINVIENLLEKADILIIGGGMTYTFLKAQGYEIGKSLCENDYLEKAKQILQKAKEKKVNLILPKDHVIVSEFDKNAQTEIVKTDKIAKNKIAIDIGPETIKDIQSALPDNGTILWNGPLGVFEIEPFSKGTFAIAESLSHNNSMTVVGGGDSVSAINQSGLADKISHISTGGGASLEFLEGKPLPGLSVLLNK